MKNQVSIEVEEEIIRLQKKFKGVDWLATVTFFMNETILDINNSTFPGSTLINCT